METKSCLQWFSIVVFLYSQILYGQKLPLNLINLPPNFHINIYAKVENARSLTLGENGIVYVGSRRAGKVYALLPYKDMSQAKKVLAIASDLEQPNGVAYHKGDLYVATVHKVLRYKNIENHLTDKMTPEIIYNSLPYGSGHEWRYLAVGPDNWLYIGIGAPCNICLPNNPFFATISRLNLTDKKLQIYAKGVRNSVGFTWHPATKQLWFTDNGRDWLGDYLPPDELNCATHKGMNFGSPYFYGNNVPDPIYGKLKSSKGMTIPQWNLPAHVAPLGLVFYTGNQFPKVFQENIFIAEHGSWNRSSKIGYRISRITLKNNKADSYKLFATGWLQGQKVWGRPVDLLVMPDGALLISDDYAGVIYRVYYHA